MILQFLRKISAEPSLLFFFAGIYFLYSAFQPLIYTRTCEQYLIRINSTYTCTTIYQSNSSESGEILKKIQEETSHWIRYTSICYAVPSLFVDCLLGSWSDFFGRKLPLIIPSIGQLLATIIYIAMSEISSIPIYWFCIASIVSGFTGGPTSCYTASYSFISAITDKSTRTIRMSILESMAYIAGTASPFIAGALLNVSSSTVVYAVSGGLFLLSIVYSSFLKEPHTDMKKMESYYELLNPAHFWASWISVAKPRQNRTYIILLILAFFLLQFVTAGELDILYLFLNNLKYSNQEFSYFFGFKFLMASISNLIILPVVKYMGVSDLTVMVDGLIAKMVGLIVFGLSKDTPSIIFSFVLDGFGIWAYSSFFSIISQTVPKEEVGKLMGVVAFTGGIALLLASSILNTIYPPITILNPGGTHFFVASLTFLSLLILILAEFLNKKSKKTNSLDSPSHPCEESSVLPYTASKEYGSTGSPRLDASRASDFAHTNGAFSP